MQIQIRFPFSLRGTLIGDRTEKYIHASYDISQDLPVVASCDAPVVLTSRSSYVQKEWRSRFVNFDTEVDGALPLPTARELPYQVRKVGERFFVFACRTDQVVERFLYQGRPAGGEDFDYLEETLIQTKVPTRKHPLAWSYSRSLVRTTLNVGDGKREGFKYVTWIERTFPPFQTWSDKVSKYRAEDVSEAEEAYRKLSSRLLVIGDTVWVAAGVPCIAVQVGEVVSVFHDHLPEIPSDALRDQYFPMDRPEEALEYAASQARNRKIIDMRLPFEDVCHQELSFDHQALRVWRQAQTFAIYCEYAIKSDKKDRLVVTDEERLLVGRAYEEARKFSSVSGTNGEPEKYIHELTDLAKRFARNRFPGFDWEKSGKRSRNRFLAETLEMFDDRPINVFAVERD